MHSSDRSTDIALWLTLVNTERVEHDQRVDGLETWQEFLGWLPQLEAVSSDLVGAVRKLRPQQQRRLVTHTRQLREVLREMAETLVSGRPPGQGSIEVINRTLAANPGYRRVETSSEGFRSVYCSGSAPAEQLLAHVADSARLFLEAGEWSLLRRCDNPKCILFFYDTSRNHSRRWCSMSACGNRAKGAAHYRRRRARA